MSWKSRSIAIWTQPIHWVILQINFWTWKYSSTFSQLKAPWKQIKHLTQLKVLHYHTVMLIPSLNKYTVLRHSYWLFIRANLIYDPTFLKVSNLLNSFSLSLQDSFKPCVFVKNVSTCYSCFFLTILFWCWWHSLIPRQLNALFTSPFRHRHRLDCF